MRNSLWQNAAKVIDHHYTALAMGVALSDFDSLAFLSLPVDFVPDEDTGFFIAYTQGMEAGSSMRMLEYEKQVIEVIECSSLLSIASWSSAPIPNIAKGKIWCLLKPHKQRPPHQKSH